MTALLTHMFGYVVEIAVKGTGLLAIAAVLAALLRHSSAAMRHLFWNAVLVALLLLPVFSVLAPRWSVDTPRALSVLGGLAVTPPAGDPASFAATDLSRGADPTLTLVPPAPGAPAKHVSLIVAIWLAGCALVAGWIAVGIVRGWRLIAGSEPAADPDWHRVVRELVPALGIGRRVGVVVNGGAQMPFVIGVFRPTVVLPTRAATWSPSMRKSVLAHELAHVGRGDLPSHLLARVACVLYWFHPGVWLAARQLRRERERACDDQVLGLGAAPDEYADQLLDLARVAVSRTTVLSPGMCMARPSQLEGRILALLSPSGDRRGITRARFRMAIALAGVAVLPVATLAFVAPPALTQDDATIWTHGPSRFQFTAPAAGGRGRFTGVLEGNVGFAADSQSISEVLTGGTLTLEQDRAGRPTVARLLVERGVDGAPSFGWWVDGVAQPVDDIARAWMVAVFPRVIAVAKWAELHRLQRELDENPMDLHAKLFGSEFVRLAWPPMRSALGESVSDSVVGIVVRQVGATLFTMLMLEVGTDTVRVSTLEGPMADVVPALLVNALRARGISMSNAVRRRLETNLRRVGSETEQFWTRVQNAYR